ncbi:helix-turn-helix domain-containing protein [Celeribacter baekdonensis]|uniref:helix-turn-helix domain-containing protein n=1 Tax=Celeribacter baekdonensis TaxID=875171 RepID=UPI0026EB884E|nr:helix-turn-helix domain-containing protein [Celeribacter baekdonensis]|tara:strand:- start:2384 stop:3472 length:1089 start_codon:yes stop_codon:yes gene_type:complete
MSVRLTHNGLPADMTPYRLKLLLFQARIALGLSSGALKYLEFAIDNCQPSDFQQGRICAIWHSSERIGTVFRRSKRQIGRIETELADAGLIKRTYPERKSRSGDRVDGVIKRAAGINLAPLIEKAEYIRLLVSRQMQADEDRKRLREHIQGLFRQIRDLDNADADEAATCILPRRRPNELSDIKKMQEVAEALEAVLADFSAVAGQPEMTVESDENVCLNMNEEKKNKTRIAEKPREEGRLNTSPVHARLLAGAQLGEYIDFYADGRPPDWNVVMRGVLDRVYELGISSRLWRERCTQLGEARTALCLIVADRNSQRDGPFGRKNAAASFAGMARKEARQIAVLDGLVGELTHALLRSGGNI